jgi:hypothetical protein
MLDTKHFDASHLMYLIRFLLGGIWIKSIFYEGGNGLNSFQILSFAQCKQSLKVACLHNTHLYCDLKLINVSVSQFKYL